MPNIFMVVHIENRWTVQRVEKGYKISEMLARVCILSNSRKGTIAAELPLVDSIGLGSGSICYTKLHAVIRV